MLVDELRVLDASSRVVSASDLGGERPDVVVHFLTTPDKPVAFQHEGISNFLGAGGLWLVTWIGGLLVTDSRYSVKMDAELRLELGDSRITRRIGDGDVDLTFFDRNDLLSVQGLQSLVLPPFWTSDQSDKTGKSLTAAAVKMAARKMAEVLKGDFEDAAESEFGCAVRLRTPNNGSPVTDAQMPIELVVISRSRGAVKVAVSVNDGPRTPLRVDEPVRQEEYAASGMLQGLDPNKENWVHVEVTTDRIHTRTLRLAPRR